MTAFEVLDQHGAGRLTVFVGALVLFLLLHLARTPLLLLARVLTVAMGRVDAFASRATSLPPHGDAP